MEKLQPKEHPMAYKVRIGRLEISCESLEELDELVGRYGAGEGAEPVSGGAARQSSGAAGSNGESSRDLQLLRALVDAGETGMAAGTVSSMLGGVRGRTVPVAVRKWAVRVKLADAEDNSACVPARPGGQRGWRLNPGALGAAKLLLGR
jgi:hypothetical protein